MAKLNVGSTTRTSTVLIDGEEAVFVFRRPTVEDLQSFTSAQVVVTGKKAHDRSLLARCEFFDTTLIEIRDLVDEDGTAITAERKAELPPNLKADIVYNLFETRDYTVIEKN